jgi:hypothetical protein
MNKFFVSILNKPPFRGVGGQKIYGRGEKLNEKYKL